MSRKKPSSIFVHLNEQGNLCIGDSIIHLPFLRALRLWAPDAEITVFPKKGGISLLGPIFGNQINEALDTQPSAEQGASFDWVFDLVGEKSSTAMRLRRMARDRFYSTALKGWAHLPRLPIYHGKHVARRHLLLLKQATGWLPESFWPWPLPSDYLERAASLLPEGNRYVGIAPGAGNVDRNKRWAVEQYAELALRLSSEGYTPVIFLGPEEAGWDKYFSDVSDVRFPEQENSGHGGPSGPALVVALATRLEAAVTNCCGSGHMFALGSAPLISLFGPTKYEKFAPFCPLGVCLLPKPEGNRNIDDIGVEDVMETVRWILDPVRRDFDLKTCAVKQVTFPEIDMNRNRFP